MGYDEKVTEPSFLNVVFPNMVSMVFHRSVEWNLLTGDGVIIVVWVHNDERVVVFNCPLNLRKHAAKFKGVIDAHRSSPDTGSNSTCALN